MRATLTRPVDSRRHPGLDVVRGASVLAMVVGHTLDVVLSAAARTRPTVEIYWSFRGLTAPLFLLVSGWVLVVSWPGTPEGLLRRLRRAGFVLALGYGLHWPGGQAARAMWEQGTLIPHLFAFDALPCIGWCLVLGALVLGATRSHALRLCVYAALAVGLPFCAGYAWAVAGRCGWPLHEMIGSPHARFPLLPWAAFFFTGGLLALALRPLRKLRHQSEALLLIGGGLVLLLDRPGFENWDPTSSWLFFYRCALALLALGALFAAAGMGSRALSALGRRSLAIYGVHIAVLYGWSGFGGIAAFAAGRLEVPAALGSAAAVLLTSWAVSLLVARSRALLTRHWAASGRGGGRAASTGASGFPEVIART